MVTHTKFVGVVAFTAAIILAPVSTTTAKGWKIGGGIGSSISASKLSTPKLSISKLSTPKVKTPKLNTPTVPNIPATPGRRVFANAKKPSTAMTNLIRKNSATGGFGFVGDVSKALTPGETGIAANPAKTIRLRGISMGDITGGVKHAGSELSKDWKFVDQQGSKASNWTERELSNDWKHASGELSNDAKHIAGELSTNLKYVGGEISKDVQHVGGEISKGAKELGSLDTLAGRKRFGGNVSKTLKTAGRDTSAESKRDVGNIDRTLVTANRDFNREAGRPWQENVKKPYDGLVDRLGQKLNDANNQTQQAVNAQTSKIPEEVTADNPDVNYSGVTKNGGTCKIEAADTSSTGVIPDAVVTAPKGGSISYTIGACMDGHQLEVTMAARIETGRARLVVRRDDGTIVAKSDWLTPDNTSKDPRFSTTVDIPDNGKGYGVTDSHSYQAVLELDTGSKVAFDGMQVQRTGL